MTNVLIAYQSFTGSCKAMAEAAAKGVGEAGGKAEIKDVAATTASDLAAHDALILVTTQPFQSLAGESKKFFERMWSDREKFKKGMTFAAIICHVNEASSTAATLDRFATYFGWKKFGEWLQPSPADPEEGKNAARQLGIAVAQGG